MRACTKCGEVKPLQAFPPVRRGESKLQTWCRDCFAQANARNYLKNHGREKARLLRYVAARRAEVRQRLIAYLRDHPCVDCGETDIVVLEFDHRGDKVADVTTYANGGRTWERVKAEIDKCDVRCANCHRRKTRAGALTNPDPETNENTTAARPTPTQLTIEAALALRTCRVCGETKPLVDFPFRSIERQTRQWICLPCQREYTNGWYAQNRAGQIANARIHRDETARRNRAQIRSYLRDHSCVDCGESDPDVLDFDHLRDKRANVSTLVHNGVSWQLVQAEIEKCEVRCANCHRRRTAQVIGSYRLKAALLRPGQGSNLRPALS